MHIVLVSSCLVSLNLVLLGVQIDCNCFPFLNDFFVFVLFSFCCFLFVCLFFHSVVVTTTATAAVTVAMVVLLCVCVCVCVWVCGCVCFTQVGLLGHENSICSFRQPGV